MSTIGAAVLLAATVLMGLYLGQETQSRLVEIDKGWRAYSDEAERRGELLSRLRGHLGYGGLIHSFKNYVLRKDPSYLEALRRQLKDFSETVTEYRSSGATPEELANLRAVAAAVSAYEAKIPIAMRAAEENWPPERTDQLVKVDDSAAVKGLDGLDAFWRGKRRETTENIAAKVKDGLSLVDTGFKFLGGLVVVALALYGLFFWLQRQLRQSILRLSDELAERRAAEHTVKKFQRAVDQSPATIIITDTNHTIEYVNRKFSDLTGYAPGEVIGRTPAFLQSGDQPPEIYADLRQRLARGEEWIGTFQNKKKSKDTYWARTAILPLRDDEGEITHYIGLGEDITERRKAREQMYRAQKMEAVGLLASGVAHDFNNVLTTILGNVFLAQQSPSRSPELVEELEQIEIAAKRARNLVNQVLTFARRQPGAADTVWVGDVLLEVSRLMRASVLPNVEIVCEEVVEDLVVHADETRLHQVVMNLCSNAAEAIGTDGGRVVLSAGLSGEEADGDRFVVIRVQDTGPGVPEEVASKIFDPFFTTKQAGKGTGLGLSVVANLVSEMGGEVKLAETSPQGTTFELVLPLSTEPLRREIGDDDLMEGSGHILLVDDEPEVVATCAKILRRLKYDVDVFTEPESALKAFQDDPRKYALVMTDYVMPEISGEELCRKVRQVAPALPVIIYSAYQPDNLDLDALAPIRLIDKPLDPSQLARAVAGLLSQSDAA